MMTQSAELPPPDRRVWVRGSPGEIPPCTLMALSTSQIRRGYNVLQLPFQIIPEENTNARKPSLPFLIKTVMACLRNKIRNEPHAVSNSLFRNFSPTLNPTNQPTLVE